MKKSVISTDLFSVGKDLLAVEGVTLNTSRIQAIREERRRKEPKCSSFKPLPAVFSSSVKVHTADGVKLA